MAETLFGYEHDELLGKSIETLLPDSFRAGHERQRTDYFNEPRTRPMGQGLDLEGRRKDGTVFPIEISLSHIETNEGAIAVAFINDITERKNALSEKVKLEHRLEHATKMEAVGRLAGGIAHDFNNLLTALSGFSEIVLDEQAYHEAALSAKTKELMGLTASMVLRCNDCIAYHIGKCHEAGVTKEEFYEAFNVALIVSGSIVIPHLRIAAEKMEALFD